MIELYCDIEPVFFKKFLDIQATIECNFTLKYVCAMISYKNIQWNAQYR